MTLEEFKEVTERYGVKMFYHEINPDMTPGELAELLELLFDFNDTITGVENDN